MVITDTWPFEETNYQMKFDYDANGNQIYVGWSIPGTSASLPQWRIMHQVFNTSNQLTDILWPSDGINVNSTAFVFSWNRRASYSFVSLPGGTLILQGLNSSLLITQGYG